jgi:DNA-directed RNA polymerase subunit RPC12/RpoP
VKCTECGREIGHHTRDRDSQGRPRETFIRCPHTGRPVEVTK